MEERRREERRKLSGKPFLALLIGALPEERRRGERRRGSEPPGPDGTAADPLPPE